MNPKGEDISGDLCFYQTSSPSPLCHGRAWTSDERLPSQSHYLALNWQAIITLFWLQCCNLNIFTILGNNLLNDYTFCERDLMLQLYVAEKIIVSSRSFKMVLRLILRYFIVYSIVLETYSTSPLLISVNGQLFLQFLKHWVKYYFSSPSMTDESTSQFMRKVFVSINWESSLNYIRTHQCDHIPCLHLLNTW